MNQKSSVVQIPKSVHQALTSDKNRGKGQQKVTVEHVHVHAGGQAVVGTIEQKGGGGQHILEEQPHAQQITYAPKPSLWCEDASKDCLTSALPPWSHQTHFF